MKPAGYWNRPARIIVNSFLDLESNRQTVHAGTHPQRCAEPTKWIEHPVIGARVQLQHPLHQHLGIAIAAIAREVYPRQPTIDGEPTFHNPEKSLRSESEPSLVGC